MRAVIYLRVSTEEQGESGAGLAAQMDACIACAARLGLEVLGPYADEGVSGSKGLDERPALLDAVAELGRGDVLLVAKRDRLGRDVVKVAMIEAAAERKGARIVSAAGEGTDGDEPGNVLMRRMIDSFAEYERLLIRSRTRAALAAKRRRGERTNHPHLGTRPAADGRTLEVDPEGARTLALIRRLRAEGLSPRRIAAELTRRGIPTPTGRAAAWGHSTVRKVLSRPA